MKKLLCILLTLLMFASLTGCGLFDRPDKPETTETPSAAPTATATEAAAKTDDPEETQPPEDKPTDEPAVIESEADKAFRELDLEIFRELVCASSDTYNQYIVSDPARFGIDPTDVTRGWGEMTYEAHTESMAYYRDMLGRLQAIDRGSLSELNTHAYDALKRTFEVNLMYEDYYYYDEPLEPMNGTHSMLPLSMICFSIRKANDIEEYLYLVEDIARIMGQIEQFEVEKAQQGLFMCETALDQVIESCRSFAEKGSSSFLITYFEEIIEKAREFGYTDAQCSELRERNKTAVLEKVLPAYSHLADTLEAHRSDCTPFVGAVKRGEKALAYFELKARDEGATMDDLDTVLEKLENMGEDIFYELTYAIYYGPDDILDKYGEEITFGSIDDNIVWLKTLVDTYYPEMPEYSLKYVEVPEDIADDFSPAAYLTPSYDDFYDNLMLVNPTSESADDLLTISHETIPGHMYQFLNARNTKGLSLAQQVMEPTGYAEAWTVFTEHFVASKCRELGKEYCIMMNTNNTFCNVYLPAYISIKVNREGWTMDNVKEYLVPYGLDEAADIFYEYAVTMPAYAMPYAVGFAYLLEIYNNAAPHNESDHKAFFEKYLSFGPMYMDMMIENMK